MTKIIPVVSADDILEDYRDTPVGDLLAYHNLDRPLEPAEPRQILIGMCMDSRKALRLPPEFAFILRTAGANLRDNEFRISYAIAVGGVRTIALIAHTDCGMKRVAGQREAFVRGLVEHAGWQAEQAEAMFAEGVPKFGISDEVEFVMGEAERLRALYPRIAVVPLLYRVEDDRLYQLRPESG
ncbi:MAG: carbonic anhydrase [Chloroflexota bacterium]